jgi:hypothetical protein
MSGATQPGSPVPSPCNGVCRIHAASGWCEGCRRSIDEIARWSAMNDAQRRQVWALLPTRQVPAPKPT